MYIYIPFCSSVVPESPVRMQKRWFLISQALLLHPRSLNLRHLHLQKYQRYLVKEQIIKRADKHHRGSKVLMP